MTSMGEYCQHFYLFSPLSYFNSEVLLQDFLDLEAALGQERERCLKISASYDSSTHARLWVHVRVWSMPSSSLSR